MNTSDQEYGFSLDKHVDPPTQQDMLCLAFGYTWRLM
jgi:hypothetical protein